MIKKNAMKAMLGILLLSSGVHMTAQRVYPPEIDCDQQIVYKTIDTISLSLWIYYPKNHAQGSHDPAVVFFFGGGWNSGSPAQFTKHCEYLSARGMVAMVADYRVATRHNVKANSCVADAKSAVRWIRAHADELGVDPERIAAGGGSAGGHLAAATATLTQHDEKNEDLSVSSKPNVLLLFNPGLIVAPISTDNEEFREKLSNLPNRLGAEPESMSPYHNIGQGLPPTIIFHGTKDTTVPYQSVEMYTKKAQELGNICTLIGYKDEGHGFFNYGRKNNGAFISTVHEMDKFLVSQGYLTAPPEMLRQN